MDRQMGPMLPAARSLNAASAKDLLQTPSTLFRRHRQGSLPDALVVDDAFAQTFDPDLPVGEGLTPEIDPHAVHEEEDQLTRFVAGNAQVLFP